MPPTDVFGVLAERRRRAVLALVAERELTAGEVAARFDVTRQALSQHLRVLLGAGLIAEPRDGTRRLYRARPEAWRRCVAYVDAMWPTALGRLKAATEAEHGSGRRDAERD